MPAKDTLIIGITREVRIDEKRVAATPQTVKSLLACGCRVIVESHAGEGSHITDKMYEQAGATIESNVRTFYSKANILVSVNPPTIHRTENIHQLELARPGSTWISFLLPHVEIDTIKRLQNKKMTALSMTLIPRISRAQKMDALTSQSNVAGFKAVLMAASELKKITPMMMTAAGTIQPSKAIIIGAGVAGLQAIATAKRLGAKVEASDVRPAVKEQVESLGATFIEVPFDKDSEDKQGYAKGPSKDFLKRQAEELHNRLKTADIVVTTALMPGKPAPKIITAHMVDDMQEGAVIVDLAAEQGGNCEYTEAGKTIIKNGVTIIGHTNIPSLVADHASQIYAKNVSNLIELMVKDGQINLDTSDEIIAGCLVCKDGTLTIEEAKKTEIPKEKAPVKSTKKKGGSS